MLNNLTECLEEIHTSHFFIKDGDDGETAFIDVNHGEFEVINNSHNSIHFLKTDSCVYNSNDGKRCDCIIYNENTFCFVELKCMKLKNFSKKRKEAEKQLELTIKDFKNESIIKNKILEAYSCCNCYIKYNDNYEAITTKPKNHEKVTYFEEELNTTLLCNTKKEFN